MLGLMIRIRLFRVFKVLIAIVVLWLLISIIWFVLYPVGLFTYGFWRYHKGSQIRPALPEIKTRSNIGTAERLPIQHMRLAGSTFMREGHRLED